jgi:acetate kinase
MIAPGMPTCVLTFNSGSSSLKFGLYAVGEAHRVAYVTGQIQTLGDGRCRIVANDARGAILCDETSRMADPATGVSLLGDILGRAKAPPPQAIGHRIVHGGPTLRQHCLIDEGVLRALHAAIGFAPLHLPPALAVIRYARTHFRGLPQVACFDTTFHCDMPETARTLPLPADLRALGIVRYGFHGLSCESIVHQLGDTIPDRVVIAHLGNGVSVTAVAQGRSIDTSMGLTPSGGVIMGTRTGDIDPGVLLYLLRERHLDATALEDVIDRLSGLAGISGIGGDVRQLIASAPTVPDAALALAMFRISVAKQIAGMIVALGGIDTLVFTGGIGEHDAATRDGVAGYLSRCGVGPGTVLTLPSREDEAIACHTAVLAGGDRPG